jgi:protocatechuate 3,4-dioxygenase beta subunit
MRNVQKSVLGLAALVTIAFVDVQAQERQIITMGADRERLQLPIGGREFKTGTGRIRGRVLAADTGAPVRRAQVRLMGPEIGAKTALSDAQGRYEFSELPAGRFTLSATKSGFVTIQYGQTRPFESGKPIELADAQLLDKADVVMPRGSVIAGRVVDEFGEPVTDAMVSAMRSVWSGGRRRLQTAGRLSQTNDLGQFRIFGLPPGDYYVSATLRGGELTAVGMAVAAVSAGGGGSGSSPGSGYAPTYFPGTSSPAEAQKVALAVGQELHGADFALMPVRLAKVTGMVIASDGRPTPGAMVEMLPRSTDGLLMLGGNAGRTDKNGAFTIGGVAPGDYSLIVRSINIVTSGGGDNFTFTARIGGPGSEDAEFGSVPVTVSGDDLANVIVNTAKGATATGRVTYEGTQPESPGSIRITAMATEGGPTIVMPMMAGGGPGIVKEDGSFELRGLAGNRLIRATGLARGWTLKSVRVEGQDVTDTGYDFKAGAAVSGVDVTLARGTDISGTVTGGNGRPVKDYTVVLFSDDPSRWTVPSTRHVAGTRGDQEGRFKVRNLPPGGYYAIAVEYVAQGEWGDPEVLERLRGKATRFTVNDGETQTLTLKLTDAY